MRQEKAVKSQNLKNKQVPEKTISRKSRPVQEYSGRASDARRQMPIDVTNEDDDDVLHDDTQFTMSPGLVRNSLTGGLGDQAKKSFIPQSAYGKQ